MNQYIRYGIYKPEEIFPFLVDQSLVRDMKTLGIKHADPLFKKATEKNYDGHSVKMYSTRYHLFKKNLVCVGCGMRGSYFALEKDKKAVADRCHFNLYGVNGDKEILFTQDHIVPISKGGASNALSNLQTMCTVCNHKKADNHTVKLSDEQELMCLIREYNKADEKATKLGTNLAKVSEALWRSGTISLDRLLELLPVGYASFKLRALNKKQKILMLGEYE
jgi:hypothetical protein